MGIVFLFYLLFSVLLFCVSVNYIVATARGSVFCFCDCLLSIWYWNIFHFTAVFLQVYGRILCRIVFTAQMLFCKCLGLFPGMSMRRGCVAGVRGERVVAAKR